MLDILKWLATGIILRLPQTLRETEDYKNKCYLKVNLMPNRKKVYL